MALIQKGKVSTIEEDGKKVTATPYDGDTVTPALVVPYFLTNALPVNTPIVYVVFGDNTGVVLSRMDGDWNHSLQEAEEG